VEYKNRYGVDGVMIGRAAIGAPWFFNEVKHFIKTGEHLPAPTIADRIDVTRKHLDFSIRWKGNKLGIFEMRRHYTNYFKGVPDFKPFRMQLVEAPTIEDVNQILNEVADVYFLQEVIA
jgi:tRNA-dihydrouridine synthase